jgi:hypothetical protein
MLGKYCILINSKSPILIVTNGSCNHEKGVDNNLCKQIVLLLLFVVGTYNSVLGQNWSQVQKSVPTDRLEEDLFGCAVSIFGDYAIVGAEFEDEDDKGASPMLNAGSAYIFKNIAGKWTQQQKIVANDRTQGDFFGHSVSISGNYAIVGAHHEDHDLTGNGYRSAAGSAYIFENKNGVWTQIQKVIASDREESDQFGVVVSIDGDYAVVGAHQEDENVNSGDSMQNAGSAYVFKNTSGTWAQLQKIVASDRGTEDKFGFAVSISGDYLVVGALFESEDEAGGNKMWYSGSAYVFKNNSGNWSQVKKIVASDRAAEDLFGSSVAISGNYMIIGAYADDEDATGKNTFDGSGSAYIFKNNAGNWVQLNKIVASDRSYVDRFGEAVAISGDYAIVGAFFESQDAAGGNTLTSSGSAYIFKNNAGSWKQVNKIVASDRNTDDRFGKSVAIYGNYAMVGAWNEDEDEKGGVTIRNAGSIYIYKNATSTGFEEKEFGRNLKVFPNPGNGNFTIDLGDEWVNTEMSISDIYGKVIQSEKLFNSQVLEIDIHEPSGMYIIEFKSGNKNAVIRIIKE